MSGSEEVETRDLGSDHFQSKASLKRIEIPIAMQQGMARLEAEGRDEAIDRFPDSMPARSQRAVIFRGCNCYCGSAGCKYMQFQQLVSYADECTRLSYALEHFA